MVGYHTKIVQHKNVFRNDLQLKHSPILCGTTTCAHALVCVADIHIYPLCVCIHVCEVVASGLKICTLSYNYSTSNVLYVFHIVNHCSCQEDICVSFNGHPIALVLAFEDIASFISYLSV